MREPFLFHSSLPGVWVPSRFLFFSLFPLSYPVTQGSVLHLWLYESFCQLSVGNSMRIVPHVDVFLMYVWEELSSMSLYSAIWVSPHII